MGRLTTHVLDTAQGRPAAGVRIEVFALGPEGGGGCERRHQRRRPLRRAAARGPATCVAGAMSSTSTSATISRPAASRCPTRRSSTWCRSRFGIAERGRALSRAAAGLALRLFHLSRELRMPAMTRNTVRFLLDGELCELTDIDPTATLLDWLRGDAAHRHQGRLRRGRLRRLHGAWSARLDGRRAALSSGQRLHPLPAHARRLPAADGREHLGRGRHAASGAAGDGRLPRLAVRLLHARLRDVAVRALAERRRDRDRRARSTTRSRAISAAAPAMRRSSRPRERCMRWRRGADRWLAERAGDRGAARGAAGRARRSTIGDGTAGGSSRPPTRRRAGRDRAADIPRRRIVAGATDVGLWVTKSMRVLDPLIYIGRVAELQAIEETPGRARDRRRASPTPRRCRRSRGCIPNSASCCAGSASVQVRNAGTIGGNIANGSPIGDTPPPLIALGARRSCCARAATRRDDAARGFLHRLRQAGPAAGRVRRERARARARRRARCSPPTRSPSASTRTSPRCCGAFRIAVDDDGRVTRGAHRLRRHGGDAEARRGLPRRR